MKQYTSPQINVCQFDNENVVTLSSPLMPADTNGYVPMGDGSFESTAYILDWKN